MVQRMLTFHGRQVGRPGGMAGHVVAFSRLLKRAGLPTHPQGVVDACRGVAAVDIADPQQVYWALRANFVNDPSQFATFDAVYRLFWEEAIDSFASEEQPHPRRPVSVPSETTAETGGLEVRLPTRDASGGASAEDVLVRKDLRSLTPEEEPRLREILRSLLAKLATRPGRRQRPSFHGRSLEFRRIFRENTRFGGEIIRLVHRERKVRRRRVVFVGDVSGSMDVYSRFFLLLAHSLARRDPGVEVYAFSTRLFRLTEFVRERDADRAVERVEEETAGWSGGTRIGESLGQLNEELGRRAHLRDTVVVIFSDGWDRGDTERLLREMVRLKGSTARIFWLNPLKGDPDYKPLCRGMAAVLPYLDGFYPAHDVESLGQFARQLARLR